MKKKRKALILIALLTVALGVAIWLGASALNRVEEVSTSEFVQLIENNQLTKVRIRGDEVVGEKRGGGQIVRANANKTMSIIVEALNASEGEDAVNFDEEETSNGGAWASIMVNVLFLGLFVFIGVMIYRSFKNSSGGGGGIFGAGGVGKTKAEQVQGELVKTRFSDVAGADEAVEDVEDIVEYLKDPSKFSSRGAGVPKGVMLTGASGTGKTLLARALAGEAGVPFFNTSGSEFVEMFVGVGAARVRDLFKKARENAPSIIFIDEIDGVAGKRGGAASTKHEEREQTLNQLLVELDGFAEADVDVIVIAASNRPDMLDPALLRPGRFDRKVDMPKPNIKGRAAILEVHMEKRGIELSGEVTGDTIAGLTPGFTGADLENLLKEAAFRAAKLEKAAVDKEDVVYAMDKLLMGPERRSVVLTPEVKTRVAIHEMGHATTGHKNAHHDPIYKVTCIPRGSGALGVTQPIQEEERHLMTEQQIMARIVMGMGGRAAEDVFYDGVVSTGCSGDLEQCTELAKYMVQRCGMGGVGMRSYGQVDSGSYIGQSFFERDYSEQAAQEIDDAVKKILADCYEEAKGVIEDNRAKVEELARYLYVKETIGVAELNAVLGEKPQVERFAYAMETEAE